MKRLLTIAPLTLVLALGVGISPATAENTTVPAAQPAFAACATQTSTASLFTPEPLFLDPPVCNPFCVTSQCTQHSDCTAAPNGRCDFACPQTGCCVYN